jgi:hypothetical protein
MPRPSADLLSPIEVHFGDVFQITDYPAQAVVVELGPDFVEAATIIPKPHGLDILGSIGTVYRSDIDLITGRWDISRIQSALLRNPRFSNADAKIQRALVDTLRSESTKPPTLLR